LQHPDNHQNYQIDHRNFLRQIINKYVLKVTCKVIE